MPIKKSKPTTPSRRSTSHVVWIGDGRNQPHKPLLAKRGRTGSGFGIGNLTHS